MCFQAYPIQRGKGTFFLPCCVRPATEGKDEMARTPAAFTLMSDENQPQNMAKK